MEFVVLEISPYGSYSYKNASNIPMCYLGCFLTSDIGCCERSLSMESHKKWVSDNSVDALAGNISYVEKGNGIVLIGDLYSEKKVPIKLKMSREQFIKLLDDWRDKVCKKMPKEVIIKHENGQFTIETSG